MKKVSLFTLLCLHIFLSSSSQTLQWQWAKAAGPDTSPYGSAVGTFSNNASYVASGFFDNTISFAPLSLSNTNATGNYQDVCLAKYDSSGNVVWVRSAQGSSDDFAKAVATQYNGNVYVGGNFVSNPLIFGNDTIYNASFNNWDIFITKYDPNGNVLWARSAGGGSGDVVDAICTDVIGVYATGWFTSGTAYFGTTGLNGNGGGDAYLVKYDSNGNLLWAKKGGGNAIDRSTGVAVGSGGSVYTAGFSYSPLAVFDNDTIFNHGSYDAFLTKYDSNGNLVWVKGWGGAGSDGAQAVAADNSGNVYVAGSFGSDTIVFENDTLINSTSGSGFDIRNVFVVKLNSAGHVVWARSGQGSDNDVAYSMTVSGDGKVYVTGRMESPTLSFGTFSITPVGTITADNPAFIVAYDTSGNVLCADYLVVGGSDQNSLKADQDNNILIAGNFGPYNPFPVGNTNLVPFSYKNIYTAKFKCIVAPSLTTENNSEPVQIYPNPVSDEITLKIPQSFKSASILIYDLLGNKISLMKHQDERNSIKIPVAELKPGMYFISVNNQQQSFLTKFVKQ